MAAGQKDMRVWKLRANKHGNIFRKWQNQISLENKITACNNQSVNQVKSQEQSLSHPMQWINESVCEWMKKQWINGAINQPVQLMNQWVNKPTNEWMNQQLEKSINQFNKQISE